MVGDALMVIYTIVRWVDKRKRRRQM